MRDFLAWQASHRRYPLEYGIFAQLSTPWARFRRMMLITMMSEMAKCQNRRNKRAHIYSVIACMKISLSRRILLELMNKCPLENIDGQSLSFGMETRFAMADTAYFINAHEDMSPMLY